MLSRVLQHLNQKVQGEVWPLFLPGVASLINNMWHNTIDDIPFRVYKQREPSSLGYTVIPEDFACCEENNSGHIDSSADEQEIIKTDTTDTMLNITIMHVAQNVNNFTGKQPKLPVHNVENSIGQLPELRTSVENYILCWDN